MEWKLKRTPLYDHVKCIRFIPHAQCSLFSSFRVLFGSSHLFVFHHPRDAELLKKDNKSQSDDKKPTFEEAQKEIAEQSGLTDLLGLDPNKSKGNGTNKCNMFLGDIGHRSRQLWKMICSEYLFTHFLQTICCYKKT